MRKNARLTIDTAPPRKTSPFATAVLFVAIVLALPLAYDSVRILISQWMSLYGPKPYVETPAIDFCSGIYQDILAQITTLNRWFYVLPWRIDYAVIGLFLCAILGSLLLRRGA